MIVELIVITALVIVLFLCLYIGFREGVRLGLMSAQGKEIKPIQNPINNAIQSIIKQPDEFDTATKKAEDLFAEGLNNIFSYTGNVPPKKEG